jgi:hypothetical protein
MAGLWAAAPSLVALTRAAPPDFIRGRNAWLSNTYGIPAGEQILGLGSGGANAVTTSLMLFAPFLAVALVVMPAIDAHRLRARVSALAAFVALYVIFSHCPNWIAMWIQGPSTTGPWLRVKMLLACGAVLTSWAVVFVTVAAWPRRRLARAGLVVSSWFLLSVLNLTLGERFGFAFPERQLSALLAGTAAEQGTALAWLAAQVGICVVAAHIDLSGFRRWAPAGLMNRVISK